MQAGAGLAGALCVGGCVDGDDGPAEPTDGPQPPASGDGTAGAGAAPTPAAGTSPRDEAPAPAIGADPAAPAAADCEPREDLLVDMRIWHAQPEINPIGISWEPRTPSSRLPAVEHAGDCGDPPVGACLDRDVLATHVLDDPRSPVAVLNALPYALRDDPESRQGPELAPNELILETRALLEARYPGRLLCAAAVMPNDRLELQLSRMDALATDVHAWVITTAWGSSSGGFALDDPAGRAVIERGLQLERPIFLVPKGLPNIYPTDASFGAPDDVARAARAFPGASLVVQGSAFEHGLAHDESSAPDWQDPQADQGWGPGLGRWPEGPYDEEDPDVQARYPLDRGVNSLIRALREQGIGPDGRELDHPDGPATTHVYAECSGVWPALAMGRELEAMHYWGKLLKHVGEDRILWGTGALFYGRPAPLLDAFMDFEISVELQERFGYPALTVERKRKILGLNAARMLGQVPGLELPGCRSGLATASLTRRQLLRFA